MSRYPFQSPAKTIPVGSLLFVTALSGCGQIDTALTAVANTTLNTVECCSSALTFTTEESAPPTRQLNSDPNTPAPTDLPNAAPASVNLELAAGPDLELGLDRGLNRGLNEALNQRLSIDLASPPMIDRGGAFHLIRYHEIEFALAASEDTRLVDIAATEDAPILAPLPPSLTAELHGGMFTYDQVTYRLSGAVFDDQGRLLGTASTEVPVQRIWLGAIGLMQHKIQLDFGPSRAWARAAEVHLSISDMPTLSPDEWQGE